MMLPTAAVGNIQIRSRLLYFNSCREDTVAPKPEKIKAAVFVTLATIGDKPVAKRIGYETNEAIPVTVPKIPATMPAMNSPPITINIFSPNFGFEFIFI